MTRAVVIAIARARTRLAKIIDAIDIFPHFHFSKGELNGDFLILTMGIIA